MTKPIVELREHMGNPYGWKTFHFVDPIFIQLTEIHGDLEFAKEFAEKTKMGWMDFGSCVTIVCQLVEIKWVDVWSEEVWQHISLRYPNMRNVYGQHGYVGSK